MKLETLKLRGHEGRIPGVVDPQLQQATQLKHAFT